MLIALDIDGTVLDWNEGLSPRVAKAVSGVVAAGHDVVLATGRSLIGTTPVADRLGLPGGWCVSSNGAVIARLDREAPDGVVVTDVATFDPAPVLLMLREHLPDALYFVEGADVKSRLASGPFPDGELTGEVRCVAFEELLQAPAARVVVRSREHTSEEFAELIASIGMHGVEYSIGWSAWLDLAPDGVSKASALEVVRQRLGIAPEQTLAVGDGSNDVEMFAWAHRAVAMGQASPAVQAVADELTASIDEDGLALVLEPLLEPGARS